MWKGNERRLCGAWVHESWMDRGWQCLGGRSGASTVDYMFFHGFSHALTTSSLPKIYLHTHVGARVHLHIFVHLPMQSPDSSTYLHTCMHVHTHFHLNCSFKFYLLLVLFGSPSEACLLSFFFLFFPNYTLGFGTFPSSFS